MFKNFLMKKALRMQAKGVPEEQLVMMEKLIDEQPELLMQIAQDLQAEMATGKDQMSAMQAVMVKHQDALKTVLGK